MALSLLGDFNHLKSDDGFAPLSTFFQFFLTKEKTQQCRHKLRRSTVKRTRGSYKLNLNSVTRKYLQEVLSERQMKFERFEDLNITYAR